MKSVTGSDTPDKPFSGLDIAEAKSPRFLVVLSMFSMTAGFVVTNGFKEAYLRVVSGYLHQITGGYRYLRKHLLPLFYCTGRYGLSVFLSCLFRWWQQR